MFSILLLLFFASSLTGQTLLQPSWVKTAAGVNGAQAEAWGIDTDDQGHVYWGVSIDNQGLGLDIEVHKFDANGVALWSSPFVFGGFGVQQAYVLHAKDTAVYVGGRYCPFLINSCDMLLLKVDKSTAGLIWDRTLNFGGNGYDEVDGLLPRPDGIYCGGWAHELEGGIYNADIGLWKLDYAGNTIWSNHFGVGGGIAEHQDGHFVVDDSCIYAAGLWGGDYIFNLYNGHAFLGKFDKDNGNVLDSTLFGAQSQDWLDIENALGMASDGEYLYITGYATPVAANDWQLFVAKYDKNLNQKWYVDWGGSGTESARAITVEGGNIFIGGLSESPSIIQAGGGRDAVLLTLDTSGNVLSSYVWGDTMLNSFLDLAVSGGDLYLTGFSERDSNTIADRSGFMLKVGGLVTGTELSSKETVQDFTLYPNPGHEGSALRFKRPLEQPAQLEVRDAHGKLVYTESLPPLLESVMLKWQTPGVYLVTVNLGTIQMSRKWSNQGR